jgi:histidinol phosphatase-like PHP family hydrolase
VDDKQQFMDMLTGKIEAIFSQEPVNIYVNPTLLPASLMPEYDQLWTPDRVARVIKVLKDNNITLEINARYKVPHPAIIREAKKAGLTFSFGTNNVAAELGRLEYCLDMIRECGLTPEDMFLPPVQEKKPVLVKGLPGKITG